MNPIQDRFGNRSVPVIASTLTMVMIDSPIVRQARNAGPDESREPQSAMIMG